MTHLSFRMFYVCLCVSVGVYLRACACTDLSSLKGEEPTIGMKQNENKHDENVKGREREKRGKYNKVNIKRERG